MERDDLTAAETRLIMQLLYDSDLDAAAELHDKLTGLGLSRLDEGRPATISVKDD